MQADALGACGRLARVDRPAPGAGAQAETYRSLQGQVALVGSAPVPFQGWLEISSVEPDAPGDRPVTLRIADFDLGAGDLALGPRLPIEYQGQRPVIYLEVADQLQLVPGRLGFMRLRSGGEVVDETPESVTFRFLELRSGASGAGDAYGEIGEGGLPRRLHLAGTLHEVEQVFALPADGCTASGETGSGLIGDGAFSLGPDETVPFDSEGAGTITIVARPGLVVSAPVLGPPPMPTLDELGIVAPGGAAIVGDGAGGLVVTTEGDLFVDGTLLELSGLTSLTLVAAGSIVIEGELALPAGVALHVEAGGDVVVEDPGEVRDGEVPDLEVRPLCWGLRPILPAIDRQIGTFSLVVTAARPMAIHAFPRGRRYVHVVVYGAPDLDVTEIDPGSLRLGPTLAAPAGRRPGRGGRGLDFDHDGERDLLSRFATRHADLRNWDRWLCLTARHRDGSLLEGCDATAPRR